jgi:hypothetical protein
MASIFRPSEAKRQFCDDGLAACGYLAHAHDLKSDFSPPAA